MLAINNIRLATGAKKKRQRIGRGNAAGQGTYSGRGLKGQKARSGVSNLKRLGMRAQLLQTPKSRGFKSLKSKNQVVSIFDINTNFKAGEEVNPETLVAKKMIKRADLPVKILGKDKLTVKVKFNQVAMSKTLAEQLSK